jgi:hypothetical protein
MATKDTLREVIRDLLPSGPFWISDAVSSYVAALAEAFTAIVDFIDGLPAAINPRTAAYAVLVDWWDYIRSDCSATPSDTEELRAQVLEALAAPPSYTFAGLQGVVSANVPGIVELRELPAVSAVPFDVPCEINEHGRILDVWFSELITNEAQLRCVLGVFAQAADTLRLLSPDATLNVVDTEADEQALHWVHAWDPCDLALERVSGVDGSTSSETYTLTEESSAATLADILGVAGSTELAEDWFSWHVERDGTQLSETRTNRDAVIAVFAAIPALSGLEVEQIFFGRRTSAHGEFLSAEGSAATAAASGLVDPFDRVYDFTNVNNEAFACQDLDLGEITSPLMVVALVDIDATTGGCVLGKMDGTLGPGWQIVLSSNVFSFFVSHSPGDVELGPLTATSSTVGTKRVLVLIIDPTAKIRFGSDLESATSTPMPTGAVAAPTIPFRLGDASTFASSFNGRLGPVALFRGDMTGRVPQTVAAAVRAALIA